MEGKQKMNELIRRERQQRWSELLALTGENIIVRKVAEMYIHGDIITMEEALSKAIVLLCTDWLRQQQAMFEMVQNLPPQIFNGKV